MNFTKDLISALNEIVVDTKWQKIGEVSKLEKMKCIKLYPDVNDDDMAVQLDDIVIFCVGENEFYAIDCSCPHEGGPLDQGDIEDIGDELAVICPWHSYDFNLKSGVSSTGLKTNTYEVRVNDGSVYIKCDHKISLNKINEQKKEKCEPMNSTNLTDIQTNGEGHEALSKYANIILNTSDPLEKARLTRKIFQQWKEKEFAIGSAIMPNQPKRKECLEIKEPGRIKRGRGGTLESRIALLHSLANIEQWAIDLSWDIIGRFSTNQINGTPLPVEFFSDFLKVADDEAKHFTLLNKRLEELGSYFGALPVHNGLWQSAEETSHDILARLAIVHMVHEARGLDVHPKTKQRFSTQKDHLSVQLMDVIYQDEITHVACGMKWFTYICKNTKPPLDPVKTFHILVKKHFKGYLKPPFNTDGRQIAGMTEQIEIIGYVDDNAWKEEPILCILCYI